ncbi:hypothetical protein T265_10082 [Opisthorchis viverrini]|uniref:DH domain-containing protein n=1 Tax=Opisthorchis viverrini TaxID=6198 RepID=A0A074Z3M9_OPIVI|nr:hypothetical protein T265_10082 [Opisthorchis viverrini]KER21638.1 hypothetical protein T265_10082 [Opisthorchis viverrini]
MADSSLESNFLGEQPSEINVDPSTKCHDSALIEAGESHDKTDIFQDGDATTPDDTGLSNQLTEDWKADSGLLDNGGVGTFSEEADLNNEVAAALDKRRQPLMELVSSEEGYVRRLRMVKEFYIPIVSSARAPTTPSSADAATLPGGNSSVNNLPLRESSTTLPPPPTVPDDLAARWRILWGNWIQLCDWHSAFLEKLSSFVTSEPDKIPKLFIDSRSRLRSIYSKYCENHRKAALIAEQYRDYFEELRLYLNDKEDVVSYLMQPVQRIMRYQLPMAEIVKYTQRARVPELTLWKRALDIMKEIPKDTQLILEAARIDGFSGVITALGNILIRGDLLVASTSREQLLETVAGYKVALQEYANAIGYPAPNPTSSKQTPPSSNISTPSNPSAPADHSVPVSVLSHQTSSTISPHSGEPVVISEPAGLYTGNLKFVECRLFLFEQMLVVTEEVKPKRRVTSDAFAQSTYQFRAAINVNKMRYESHWYNCSLPNGHTNADAAAVDHLLSTGFAPDDLRFAVLDQTPGRGAVYVIDPITSANRQAWVVQLRDIQRMQQEFLLALQDPRRFNTGNRDDNWGVDLDTSDGHSSRHEPQPPVVSVHNDQPAAVAQSQPQRQRKWPSFTVKRPARIGSTSSPSAGPKDASSPITKPTGSSMPESSNDRTASLARSLSAERRTFVRTKLDMGTSVSDSKFLDNPDSSTTEYRKSSLSASSSIKISHEIRFPDSSDATGTESKATGVGKKRNVFANLFGRNKSKHRGKHSHSHTHPPTPGSATSATAASLGAPEHEDEESNVTSPAPVNPTSDIGTTEETMPITSSTKFDCSEE